MASLASYESGSSYLNNSFNRLQYAAMNNQKFTLLQVKSEIPQESILGPLLLII